MSGVRELAISVQFFASASVLSFAGRYTDQLLLRLVFGGFGEFHLDTGPFGQEVRIFRA